jgi:hypothetical protein
VTTRRISRRQQRQQQQQQKRHITWHQCLMHVVFRRYLPAVWYACIRSNQWGECSNHR